MDPKTFKAPFIDKQQCWHAADSFRTQYWNSDIPVDVLEIAEFELDLEIRTISSLREECDVDALLLGDWKTLIVDQREFMEDRFHNKLRFSVAHEIGHFVLHRETFDKIPRGTADEWIAFMQEMPDKEYGFLEFHANEFAGRLLVPYTELQVQFEKSLKQVEDNGMSRTQLTEAHLAYLCTPLAKHFAVSAEVIEKRLNRERLWPLS